MSEKTRVLFIGELISSHAQSWIGLLDGCDDFSVAGVDITPFAWGREKLPFPVFHRAHALPPTFFQRVCRRLLPRPQYNLWFADEFIQSIQRHNPHIVHTFGILPTSQVYLALLRELAISAHWVAQARGGPDIALNRKSPDKAEAIAEVLRHCDTFIADNAQNYTYAQELGLDRSKMMPAGIMPGTGGIDLDEYAGGPPPSQKQRIILWPKAYTCIQSDGLAVVEALRRALPRILPCRIIATAATPDVEYWFRALLEPYSQHIEIHPRLPRRELLNLYASARVLLAPSLSDGIPNTLYEAMASGAAPIVSPLETLTPLFSPGRHVLYARNLDPQEVADALVLAMSDDALVDAMAAANTEYVRQLADRERISAQVRSFYRTAASNASVREK